MMLTSKIPQTEPLLEAMSFTASAEGDMPEKSGFSGLFSSMLAAQEEATLNPEQQIELPVMNEIALNLVSAPVIEEQVPLSMNDIVSGMVTQLDSSSSTQLKSESIKSLNINTESDALNLAKEGQSTALFTTEPPYLSANATLVSNSEPVEKDVVSFSEASPAVLEVEGEEASLVSLEVLGEVSAPPSVPIFSDSRIIDGGSSPLSDVAENFSASKLGQSLDSVTFDTNVPINDLAQGVRGVELNIVQERAVIQGTSSSQIGSVASGPQSYVSSSVLNQSTTSWGTQSVEGQAYQGSGQQTQTSGQSSQQGSSQSAQQQAMIFAQGVQENRQRSQEQQMAVRAMDDAIAKSEGKELLGGAEIASLDRKGSLPAGLQAINIPLKHPQWGQALGQRIVFMSNNSLQQAQITLNPQSLGQIQVTLQLDKEQKMHISLAAQNGMTRESMENALPKLREMMEQAGVQVASVDVREQKQQFSENESRHAKHDNGKSEDSFVEEGSVQETSLVKIGLTDNIVDYYA